MKFQPLNLCFRPITNYLPENGAFIQRVTPEVYKTGIPINRFWTHEFIEAISAHIDFNTIKNILDVGTRDCYQSVEFCTWFPDAQVYAFEANPEQIELCRSVAQPYKNIHVINKAASDTHGIVTFNISDSNVGASSLLKVTNHHRSSHWVQRETTTELIRLDDWCVANNVVPDLLWVDVQGAEMPVFKGLGVYLNKVKAIATEVNVGKMYHGATMKDELDAFLKEMGFEAVAAYHMSYGSNNTISQIAADSGEVDVIYINKQFMR